MNEALNEVINTIINSDDYKKCIELNNTMASNEELVSLIEEIKKLQKKYVNTRDQE